MVKNIFSILSSRQTSILSGASILMTTVLATKILGLVRSRLLVHNFSTSQASTFFGAFSLPDLLFQILIFGALSVAFIPIFTEHMNKKGEEDAYQFASSVLNLTLFVFIICVVLAFIFVSPLNSLLVPGFTGQQKFITDQMTRIILFAQIFLVVGSFFYAIGNSFQRFIIPALAPLFYNIGIIVGIVFFSKYFGLYGVAYGVVLGAFLHAVIQIPLVKSLGFKYKFSFDFFNSGVREVFKLMSIRNISIAAEQINDRVSFALATLITTSAPTLLTFALQLQVVPIGLFGATIAQAALPVLSKERASGQIEHFKITLLTTIHQILFLTLPASALLIVIRVPVVRLIYGASQFNWDDTVLTGRTLAFLAIALAAQSVSLLLVRGFYALKDTKTPVSISIVSVALNISMGVYFVLILKLDVGSIGLAYAVSNIISTSLLLFALNKKVGGFDKKLLFVPFFKMLIATVIMGVALYVPIKLLDKVIFDTTKTLNLIILTSFATTFALSIYVFLVWFMRVKELDTYAALLRKVSRMQNIVKSEELLAESGSV